MVKKSLIFYVIGIFFLFLRSDASDETFRAVQTFEATAPTIMQAFGQILQKMAFGSRVDFSEYASFYAQKLTEKGYCVSQELVSSMLNNLKQKYIEKAVLPSGNFVALKNLMTTWAFDWQSDRTTTKESGLFLQLQLYCNELNLGGFDHEELKNFLAFVQQKDVSYTALDQDQSFIALHKVLRKKLDREHFWLLYPYVLHLWKKIHEENLQSSESKLQQDIAIYNEFSLARDVSDWAALHKLKHKYRDKVFLGDGAVCDESLLKTFPVFGELIQMHDFYEMVYQKLNDENIVTTREDFISVLRFLEQKDLQRVSTGYDQAAQDVCKERILKFCPVRTDLFIRRAKQEKESSLQRSKIEEEQALEVVKIVKEELKIRRRILTKEQRKKERDEKARLNQTKIDVIDQKIQHEYFKDVWARWVDAIAFKVNVINLNVEHVRLIGVNREKRSHLSEILEYKSVTAQEDLESDFAELSEIEIIKMAEKKALARAARIARRKEKQSFKDWIKSKGERYASQSLVEAVQKRNDVFLAQQEQILREEVNGQEAVDLESVSLPLQELVVQSVVSVRQNNPYGSHVFTPRELASQQHLQPRVSWRHDPYKKVSFLGPKTIE